MLQSTGSRAGGLQKLQHVDSVAVAPGLQSTDSVVVAHRLSCPGMWDLPDQGSNLCLLH